MNLTSHQSPVLLTGATGHTGRRLAALLLAKGATLRCLIHTPERKSRLPTSSQIQFHFGSADSESDLSAALEGVDTVFQLAHIRYARPLISTLEKRCTAERTVRLIAMSSTRILSRFPSETRESVRDGEAAIQNSSSAIRWTILRASMIFGGPDDNNLERLAQYLKRTRFFPIFGSGRNLVQPLFVTDLTQALADCLENENTIRKTYTLAGPEPISYTEMVQGVARASGSRHPVFVRLPLRPALAIAHLLTRVWPGNPLHPEMVERFGESRAFDISEARKDFGFAPTPFEQSLQMKFRREV